MLSVNAQTSVLCLQLANDLKQQQSYVNAASLYERVLLFDETLISANLYFNLAECKRNTGNMSEAINYYEKAWMIAPDDSTKNELLFTIIHLHTAQQNYQEAEAELLNFIPVEGSEYFISKNNFYSGIVSLGLDKDSLAQFYILSFVKNGSLQNELERDFKLLSKKRNKKLLLSQVMSIILPGSGQLYLGDYKAAINSFLLLAAFGLTFSYVSYTYGILDAYLSIGPWFQRYYKGGVMNNKYVLQKQVAKRKQVIYDKLISSSINNLNP